MTDPAMTDREVLSGVVERVTVHNPDNGFCVLRVTARGQREFVTIAGHAASITAGEYIQVAGRRSRSSMRSGTRDRGDLGVLPPDVDRTPGPAVGSARPGACGPKLHDSHSAQ